MKLRNLLRWSSALCLSAAIVQAQEASEVEQLKRQLKQLQENFEKAQREQKQQIDSLTKQLDELVKRQTAETEKKKLEEQLASDLQKNQPAPATPPAATSAPWSPSQPITIARAGSAYMNVSFGALIGVGGSTASDVAAQLNLGDHDPLKRGFYMRNAEIALDGAVDPYFKGFANIVFKLDKNNQTDVELEETFLQSTALPANLQLKAGQFFANFGRQNSQHPHAWAFVDQPLILNRVFGPDGLRNVGAQLSWLVPTPFYSELFLGVFDGQGGTAFSFRNPGETGSSGMPEVHGRTTFDRSLRGAGDLLLVPRWASSFDLTDTQTLVVGASGAFGPNDTGPSSRTEIYGVDAYWKWKPATAHAGFPFVSWQTEAMYQRFGAGQGLVAGLPSENLRDWGFYSQVLWGFQSRWVAGLRGEFVTGDNGAFDASDVFRGDRTRVSPNLTWYPSEFSKIRLQYNYDHGKNFGDEHSAWLQLEFLLGAHAAHKF